MIYGRSIIQPRMVYACGEPGLIHTYSRLSLPVNDWNSDELNCIKKIAKKLKKELCSI